MRGQIPSWAAGLVGAIGLFASGCGSASHKSSPVAPPVMPDASTTIPDVSTPDATPTLADVVFSLSGHVDGGGEAFDCVYVRMPADRGSIAVPSAESHYTPGSHHFLVYRTSYDSLPDGGD